MRSYESRRFLTPLLTPLLTLFVALAAVGCGGYALVGRATNIPDDVRTIYVSPLENRTNRSQVEQVLTRAITDELVTRQRFQVASSAQGSNAEIRGTVVGYAATPVTFDKDSGRATEYEISLVVQIIFQRIPTSEDEEPQVLWRNDRYQFREAYLVQEEGEDYFDREDQAIEELSERFAETMVSDLLEGF